MKERDEGEWKSSRYVCQSIVLTYVAMCVTVILVQISALNILVKGLEYCTSICTINNRSLTNCMYS